jgi:hypothetical protein
VSALVTALGWVGAVTCLVAYVMVTRGRWSPTSGRYQLTNVVSGALMGLVAARSGVWPSVATNLVWTAVGIYAVSVILVARRRHRAEATATATATMVTVVEAAEAITEAAGTDAAGAEQVEDTPVLPTQRTAAVLVA